MSRRFALAVLIAVLSLAHYRASAQQDQYIQIYTLIQQGDAFQSGGQTAEALAKYRSAQEALQTFQKAYPDWNTRVVRFRLNYLDAKLAELAPQPGAAPAVAPAGAGQAPAPSTLTPAPAPDAAAAAASAALEKQVVELKDQVRQLQSDKVLLQARLKEALSAQPVAADPRELARAEDRIRSLAKENELLRVSLNRQKKQARVAVAPAAAGVGAAELAEANQKAAEQAERTQALIAENEILKKQVSELQSGAGAVAGAAGAAELAAARAQIAQLESDKELLRLEKVALQGRVDQLSAAPAGPLADAVTDARVAGLERELASVRRQLDAAQKELAARGSKGDAERIDELASELQSLRAKVAVFEAQEVPYSPEEMALFKPAAPSLTADFRASARSGRAPASASAALVAEARRDFAARRFDQAEAKYLELLSRDEHNVYTLANLAAIQLEMNHLDDAEKHIRQALAEAPDDPYSLLILGEIELHRDRFDPALDALSRAAKLDPQNPEIQNYLGLTLSEKGLRKAAETAFRKAIQLEPNYATAHHNLAVFYITQKPPWPELARWHYQKALAAGFPRNPDLEKLLQPAEASAAAKP